MKKNPIDPNKRRLPPLSWCEYQIMQKIAANKGMTRYAMSTYAENLEECEKDYGLFHNIDKLVKKWKKQGLVFSHKIHDDYPITRWELTDDGREYLKRHDNWFGYPFS